MSIDPQNEFNAHEKLCAVISVLQAEILAKDSSMIAAKMFKAGRFETGALELAERMLVKIFPEVGPDSSKVESVTPDVTQ